MNDDDYWSMSQPSYTRELYDLIKNYEMYKDYSRKDDMAYSYSRGYYSEDTNSKAIATAVLEAYADGVPFETLIKKNKAVQQYWYNIQAERGRVEQARIKEQARLAKLAEKQAAEKAQREEVMTKLTKEELEAFGLVRKGKR
jgi:hypothetical protein